jgi:hypothetical protein
MQYPDNVRFDGLRYHVFTVFIFAILSIAIVIFALVMAVLEEETAEKWIMVAIFVFAAWVPSPGHKLLSKTYRPKNYSSLSNNNIWPPSPIPTPPFFVGSNNVSAQNSENNSP